MNSAFFYSGAFFIYLLALIVELFSLLSKKSFFHKIGMYTLFIGFLFQTPGLILRGIEMNFIPITNVYEAVTFVAWIGAVVVFYMYKTHKIPASVGFISTAVLVGFYAVSSSPLVSPEIAPPVPILRSYWLVLHISFAFLGEVFFIVSFAAALAYLFSKTKEKRARMDDLTYKTILIGFPFFTLGALVFGAIWAKFAWGRFWSWDPKESWSLITWLFYAGYLHSRYVLKWKGKKSIILALVAFAAMIFTFFGVDFLGGLHSTEVR